MQKLFASMLPTLSIISVQRYQSRLFVLGFTNAGNNRHLPAPSDCTHVASAAPAIASVRAPAITIAFIIFLPESLPATAGELNVCSKFRQGGRLLSAGRLRSRPSAALR